MSCETSSDQSYVRKGASYDEVYLSSQDDPNTSHDKWVLSTNSPSSEEDEDLDIDESEGDSNDEDIGSVEPLIQSVISPDGLRQLFLFPLWTINDFYSTIKKKNFDTLREKY